MARGENQGLQIALILFIFLIVGLSVTTYVFYSASDKASIEVLEAEQAKAGEKKRGDRYYNSYELLKRTIGRSQFTDPELDSLRKALQTGDATEGWTEVEEIEAQFTKDMTLFEQAYTESKDYGSLVTHLMDVIGKRNKELLAALDREKKLAGEKKSAIEAEVQKTIAALAARDAALKEQKKLSADFNAERLRFKDESTALASDLDTKRTEYKTLQDTTSKQIQNLENQVAKLTRTIKDQQDRLVVLTKTESFEKPDGRITWVNQKTNRIWINLGSADGLRRQITFTVFDRDENNVESSKPKGTIEVTQIVDRHLAEAQITDDDVANPILSGDIIYTPAWKPGRFVRFALVGLIDVNGNGRSDSQLVHNLINTNAGQVDAEVTIEGKAIGALSPNTRYLVRGEAPDDKSSREALNAYSLMLRRAAELGIEEITVEKLLDLMGFRGEVQTVPLGRRGAAAALDSSRESFRERRPPARGGTGAY